MARIDEEFVNEGIKIAVSAIINKGFMATIGVKSIPKDDKVKEGEFIKIAIFNGSITYGNEKRDFDFFVEVINPYTSNWKSKDWALLVINSFLSYAAVAFEGDHEKMKCLIGLMERIPERIMKF